MPTTAVKSREEHIAILRNAAAEVVAAAVGFDEAWKRLSLATVDLDELCEGGESICTSGAVSFEAEMDIQRRAKGIQADIDTKSDLSLGQTEKVVEQACELRAMVDLFVGKQDSDAS